MIETILIWLGSGFAFTMGILACLALVGLTAGSKKKTQDYNEASLAALTERNRISRDQAEYLSRIAAALEELTDQSSPKR